MTPLWLMLMIPLSGIVLLAFIGHLRLAGWINVAFSACTLAASLWLAVLVLAGGPLMSPSRMLYIDAFSKKPFSSHAEKITVGRELF